MSPPDYPSDGRVPAVPASVSPGKIIVAPNDLLFLNIRLARDSAKTQTFQTRTVSVIARLRHLRPRR